VIQVTPLRMDLWFPLLVIAYISGPYSIYLGIASGLLVIFTNGFGMMYAFCYLELVGILYIADIIYRFRNEKFSFLNLKELTFKHGGFIYKNILILIASYVIYAMLFQKMLPESTSHYMKLHPSFLPVSAQSFYWYVPAVLSGVICLLFALKAKIKERYFTTGIYLVLFSAGLSVYFFGRSHENNIINIGFALIFAFFVMLDLAIFKINGSKTKENKLSWKEICLGLFVPFILLLLVAVSYSDRMNERLIIQNDKIAHRYYGNYPNYTGYDPKTELVRIKQVTNNSNKVFFFVDESESLYYYYGGYKVASYYSPLRSWMLKKDFALFLQDVLDKGYFVVGERIQGLNELLPTVKFNKKIDDGRFEYLWIENDGTLILPGNEVKADIY
jgi:hypothetical protein